MRHHCGRLEIGGGGEHFSNNSQGLKWWILHACVGFIYVDFIQFSTYSSASAAQVASAAAAFTSAASAAASTSATSAAYTASAASARTVRTVQTVQTVTNLGVQLRRVFLHGEDSQVGWTR